MTTSATREIPPMTVASGRRGARGLLGAAAPAAAFGIGFGAAAAEAGMTAPVALAMSATVFAGAAQYAALELWAAPLPLLGLVMMTLAVNARHIVLGATLHGYLTAHPPFRRYAALALLSDANWAATQQAIMRGERDLAHLIGGGLLLWTAWVAGTAIGLAAGKSLGDLGRFGIDAVMPAFFICALIGMAKTRADIPPWAAAGAASGVAAMVMPVQWAILSGALAGAIIGALRDVRR